MTQDDGARTAERPRGRAARAVAVVIAAAFTAGFAALGVWQLQRRTWKLDLIAHVDARVHAPPAPAPGPGAWPRLTAARDEYRNVSVRGTFENDRETLVQAVTDDGPGFWVLTPLRADAGFVVLVNRGFVPPERAQPSTRAAGLPTAETTVTGLLRMSEPHGGFLRANDPAAGRWFSRDVAAIARARGLSDAAPYFIDADATPNESGWPRGGLTVVRFRNSHLAYALTWFTLAVMAAVGGAAVMRDAAPARRRRSGAQSAPGHGRHF